MNKDHGLIIALLLISIGSFGSDAKTWSEVLTPPFVFGSIAAVGASLKALYTPKPERKK